MCLLSFRVELQPGLEVHWNSAMGPSLAVALTEDERTLLRGAGGPERWKHLEAPLTPIRAFIFEGVPLRPDGRIGLARIGDRLRLTLSFSRQPIAVREYPEKIFHDAMRLIGHGNSFAEVMTRLRDHDYLNLRQQLRDLASGSPPAAAEEDDDPERAAWEAVWADEEEKFEPPPPAQEARQEPPQEAPVPPPPAKRPAPEEGPLRASQVRLYLQTLRANGKLPDNLSEAARKQVLASASV